MTLFLILCFTKWIKTVRIMVFIMKKWRRQREFPYQGEFMHQGKFREVVLCWSPVARQIIWHRFVYMESPQWTSTRHVTQYMVSYPLVTGSICPWPSPWEKEAFKMKDIEVFLTNVIGHDCFNFFTDSYLRLLRLQLLIDLVHEV